MKKLLSVSTFLSIIAGIIMIVGGLWGIFFTYNNVAREDIVTPPDSSIPNTPVRGPFTLKAQTDIMRHHVLTITGGKTYSQMPQKVQQLDAAGKPVLDAKGQPVMVPNAARDIWVTATALITALNLAIVSYLFSGLIVFFGLISIWTGITFSAIKKNIK